jgi:CO/xanthine dehydrogenase FAD-binding subunit
MPRLLKPFEYFEPDTIEEAVKILTDYSETAKVLAGGVDLVARMRKRKVLPKCVVSIRNIPGLDGIENTENGVKFGALVTLADLEFSPIIQKNYISLYKAIHQISSAQVKNMGTAIGNVCVATPASDVACSLISLGASLKIVGSDSERFIPIESLCIGCNQTILKPGEIVTEALVPRLPKRSSSAFANLVRTAADVSKVNVAVSLSIDDGICVNTRIALGAVAPILIRATKAEAVLIGSKPRKQLIEQAADTASQEAQSITDIRSTAEYRTEMVRVLVRRALEQVIANIGS